MKLNEMNTPFYAQDTKPDN